MKKSITITIMVLIFSTFAWAGDAPWWEWKNLESGSIVCAQTSPGKGWVKYTGPYVDLRCTTLTGRSTETPAHPRTNWERGRSSPE